MLPDALEVADVFTDQTTAYSFQGEGATTTLAKHHMSVLKAYEQKTKTILIYPREYDGTKKTEQLLQMNSIDPAVLDDKIYQTLMLGVFEVLCKDIRKKNVWIKEREVFRKYTNKLIATKKTGF